MSKTYFFAFANTERNYIFTIRKLLNEEEGVEEEAEEEEERLRS